MSQFYGIRSYCFICGKKNHEVKIFTRYTKMYLYWTLYICSTPHWMDTYDMSPPIGNYITATESLTNLNLLSSNSCLQEFSIHFALPSSPSNMCWSLEVYVEASVWIRPHIRAENETQHPSPQIPDSVEPIPVPTVKEPIMTRFPWGSPSPRPRTRTASS